MHAGRPFGRTRTELLYGESLRWAGEVSRAIAPHLGREDFVTAALAQITATGKLGLPDQPRAGQSTDRRSLGEG